MVTLGDATARYNVAYHNAKNHRNAQEWKGWYADTVQNFLNPHNDREVLCRSYAFAWLTPSLDVESSMEEYRRLRDGEYTPKRQTGYFWGKAVECYHGDQLAFPWEHKQRKVYTFGQSLIRSFYGQDSIPCIDRHMLSIALGRQSTPKERSKLFGRNKSLAMTLEEALCAVAKENNLKPQELQSILWHDYRVKEGIEQ